MSTDSSTGLETWERFRTEVDARGERLQSELRESWKSLGALLASQAEAFSSARLIEIEDLALNTLSDIFSPRAAQLLLEPAERYRYDRPQQRALRAFEDWDRGVEGLIRAMPDSIAITGAEWTNIAGGSGLTIFSRSLLRWWHTPKPLTFRQSLLQGFHDHRKHRRTVEGRLLCILAEASLDIVAPWQAMLQIWLPKLASEPPPSWSADKEISLMHLRIAGHEKRIGRALDDLRVWLSEGATKIANSWGPGRSLLRGEARMEADVSNYFRYREFWVRQGRAVDSAMDLECRFVLAGRNLAAAAHQTLVSIDEEHAALLKELNHVLTWLENWKPNEPSKFPSAQAEVVSSAARTATWQRSVGTALEQVPESIEVSSRLSPKPGWLRSWRTQMPRQVFKAAMELQTSSVVQEGLRQLESQHQTIVREIERAREVVAFAIETARSGEPQIEREGVENARSLLTFHREHIERLPPEVERSLYLAVAAASLRTHAALEEGQFGIIRHAVRYGLPAAMRRLRRFAARNLRVSATAAVYWATKFYNEALIRIGWVPAPTARIEPVVARGYLSHTLGGEFRPERLPMIYQRLFRLVPVDDARFLVGRQRELAALVEARSLWERGREAGVLIVGERGSGKTSLVNCALHGALEGLDVVRAEFSQRLTQRDEMDTFLAGVVGVKPEDLEKELTSKRRVIVLEEMERAFLRRISRYQALRSLLNLISKTSRQTLWVLSTNYFAFRLLNASLRLDPHFSHRINAMAVDRDYLRDAILMRHNLSGLRLLFAPPSEGGYSDRLRKAVGVETDLEMEFFDAIYRESGGVFRTAFALWQRYVDRAEGGILYMRYPAIPSYDGILKSLNDADLFTLAAILQHGSLTPEEHGLIFQIDEATSKAWLDNLIARELIQPDPGRSGLRVVPEAGEVVRRTLFRRNVG